MAINHSGILGICMVLLGSITCCGCATPTEEEHTDPLHGQSAEQMLAEYADAESALRTGRERQLEGLPVYSGDDIYKAYGDQAVPEAAKYLEDENHRVRFWAGTVLFMAIKYSQDPSVRRMAAREIIRHLNDHQTMARWTRGFPPDVFDDEAKRLLVAQIRAADNHHFARPLIISAGLADAVDLKPNLQRWAGDPDHAYAWASNLALARWGDRQALQRVMDHVGLGLPDPDNREGVFIGRTIKELCYVKQPETIEWVIQALNSDLGITSDGDAIGFTYAQRAALPLSEVLTMPDLKDDFARAKDIEAARKWVAEHYVRENFEELVDGEVREWRW
ncbi:MAG: hypothetical protein ACPGYV_01305 [Phycisphaeraceae bacterium]